MTEFIDNELKKLLACYTVDKPGYDLVTETKFSVHRELAVAPAVSTARDKWVFVLSGLGLSMALCLFYMITVGAVLRFILPENMVAYVKYSFVVCTTFGGSMFALTMLLAGYRELVYGNAHRWDMSANMKA